MLLGNLQISFLLDSQKLNLAKPRFLPKATDHIPEQISLIEILESKGYVYRASDGMYFNSSKFIGYGEMANLTRQNLKTGARVKMSEGKKNPTDFALWKFLQVTNRDRWNGIVHGVKVFLDGTLNVLQCR
jgi:cysteinyl-tRNA synthetase